MKKLITEQLQLKKIKPQLAQAIAKEYGIKEEDVTLIRKGLVPADTKFEEGERAAISYITTNEVDRDKEIVDPKGAMLKDYRKHPVVLFGHNYSQLPIGRNEWIKADEKGLIAKTVYANTPEAEKIYQYRKDGFPLAESIGFVPIKFRDLDEAEQKTNKGARRIYDKWILLEYSDVAVPSNPGAMEIAVSKGLLTGLDEFEVDDTDIVQIEDKTWEEEGNDIKHTIRNQELFQSDSFRLLPLTRTSPKVFGVAGKLKDQDSLILQSIRFYKGNGWDKVKAKSWAEKYNIKEIKLEDLLLKILKEEEEPKKEIEKSGRVLSKKNRSLIKTCIDALNRLHDATEPEPKPEPKKEYDEEYTKLFNQVVDIVKKLQ